LDLSSEWQVDFYEQVIFFFSSGICRVFVNEDSLFLQENPSFWLENYHSSTKNKFSTWNGVILTPKALNSMV